MSQNAFVGKPLGNTAKTAVSVTYTPFLVAREPRDEISYTKSRISYTKFRLEDDFVYERILVCAPKNAPQTGFRWNSLVKSTNGDENGKTHFVENPLENQRNFVSGLKTASSANFVLLRFRHTKFPFVYEISNSYTKFRLWAWFRIRNHDFVYRNFVSKTDFVYEISSLGKNLARDEISYTKFRLAGQFRIRNFVVSYTKFRLPKYFVSEFS